MARKTVYREELKSEALKMMIEQGMSRKEVSDLLNIPMGTLTGWVSKKKQQVEDPAPGTPSVSDLMTENRRLRVALSKSEMEKEILKKAAAYFAKESLPGTRS